MESKPYVYSHVSLGSLRWSEAAEIPIDPALQQQSQLPPPPTTQQYNHYAAYAAAAQAQTHSQYAQAPYTHYQYPPPQPPQTAQAQAPVMATPSAPAPKSSGIDTADIATLNDALGSAGVDLRAEEETLHRTTDNYQSYRPYEDRSRRQPSNPNFDTRIVGSAMREIGKQYKVTKVPEESVNYLALSLRARLEELVKAMIAASAHRTNSQFDRPASSYEDGTPMWNITIRSDVAKQLAAIEKVEREEEMKIRRERKERQDMAVAHAAALAVQSSAGSAMAVDNPIGDEGDGQPKKKKKKEGPGVTARNMSEDVRKKMSNAVASQAAGLPMGKYSWMNAASSAAAKPKPAARAPSAGPALSPATTTAPAPSVSAASGWAKPYVPSKTTQQAASPREDDDRRVVTLKDAMFVIENERGHGGGRGSARGWT